MNVFALSPIQLLPSDPAMSLSAFGESYGTRMPFSSSAIIEGVFDSVTSEP